MAIEKSVINYNRNSANNLICSGYDNDGNALKIELYTYYSNRGSEFFFAELKEGAEVKICRIPESDYWSGTIEGKTIIGSKSHSVLNVFEFLLLSEWEVPV